MQKTMRIVLLGGVVMLTGALWGGAITASVEANAQAAAATTAAAPTIESEKNAVEQTIEQTVAVEPKVFSPVPDINKNTQPSVALQQEAEKIAPAKVAVDDKGFAEQPASPDKKTVAQQQEIKSDLDTTAVDAGGNWLIKRAFWEQAERTYEKIMTANNTIYEQQITFVKARNQADDLSDKSFRNLGFEQGQLANLLERLLDEAKVQREQQGLAEQGRQLVQALKDKQQELEQLKTGLEAINKLDDALDETMIKLNAQVTACRGFEKRAWDNLKAIGRELNDKKARTLFYEMEGFLKTVEKNRDYLSGELWRYFDDTASTMNKKFEELATKVKESQQKGVDLSGELERLIKADKEKERQALDKEHKTIETEQQKLERERHELEQQKAAVEAAKNKTWWMPWVDEAKKLWRSWSQMVLDGTSWILHRFGIK